MSRITGNSAWTLLVVPHSNRDSWGAEGFFHIVSLRLGQTKF